MSDKRESNALSQKMLKLQERMKIILEQLDKAKKDLAETISIQLYKHPDFENMADLKKGDIPYLVEAIVNDWQYMVERGKSIKDEKKQERTKKREARAKDKSENSGHDGDDGSMECDVKSNASSSGYAGS